MERTGFGLLTKRARLQGEVLLLQGTCALKLPPELGKIDFKRLHVRFGDGEAQQAVRTEIRGPKGLPFIKGYRLYPYRIEIRLQEALQMDVQNKIFLYYGDERICDVTYSLLERRQGVFRNTKVLQREGKSMYFRQTVNNKLWFVVRVPNKYDDRSQSLRVFLAWLLAKLPAGEEPILMYEKEASRYEESASVLYEKLIDRGYKNIYYVVNRDNPAIRNLDQKYRRNLIDKDSFRHLLCFFRTKTFVGTETVEHAAQLRAANRRLMSKARSLDLTHVFLQHGVMYMVSLDADLRVGFVSRKVKKYRTVVSSEAEAMHFIRLGGFSREELYVTGLAKFDRSYREPGADLIMIMPTWRRWETNQAEQDFEQTGYYRMLQRMVSAVPEELRDRIVIKPHPLMQEMMQSRRTGLSEYLRPDLSHDETLRRTALLITDYSSIAYDAFYRGANVIFCWEEREECMRHYGGAHLMLNEYNAFGDVTRSQEQLVQAVQDNYNVSQRQDYLRKYRRIVAFDDNRNTDRIIEMMKRDRILK